MLSLPVFCSRSRASAGRGGGGRGFGSEGGLASGAPRGDGPPARREGWWTSGDGPRTRRGPLPGGGASLCMYIGNLSLRTDEVSSAVIQQYSDDPERMHLHHTILCSSIT